jgi:4-hydroxy-3-polyprenylbenzoate decarboxylase
MQYRDLRDFISGLEQRGELKRIQVPVSPVLEMTEVCDRTLRAKGPALLFENQPVTTFRCSATCSARLSASPGHGRRSGQRAARNRQAAGVPQGARAAEGLKDAWSKLPIFRKIISMAPKVVKDAVCQEVVIEGDDVDLGMLPVQTCWPGDVAR